jgi:REP element-mobilizing transposase RayT
VHRRAVEEALGDFSYEDAQAFEELAEAEYEDDFQAVEPIEADETPAHADADAFDYAQPMEPIGAEAAVAAGATTGAWYDLPEQDFNTQFEMMAAFQVLGEDGVSKGALYTEVPVEPPPPPTAEDTPVREPEPQAAAPAQDPYLAQLALSLTEVSLELTAEATLLARDQQIVAYAGRMDAEEIDELRGTIADDWDAAPGEVRIRFITAQGSGRDYMLYSRRTEDDFTLSLIFAGTTPLRDIRRQGKRLVDALRSVPEAPPAPPPIQAPTVPVKVEPLEVGARTPYAYVWLLRDPRAHLDSAVSQAIISGLNVQMREKQWAIQTLQVHEDYVYLLADVPGEELPYQTVRDLKRRSAEIAHAQNPAYAPERLWANSYLVVTPGRELDQEEIQQFINFDRM